MRIYLKNVSGSLNLTVNTSNQKVSEAMIKLYMNFSWLQCSLCGQFDELLVETYFL